MTKAIKMLLPLINKSSSHAYQTDYDTAHVIVSYIPFL